MATRRALLASVAFVVTPLAACISSTTVTNAPNPDAGLGSQIGVDGGGGSESGGNASAFVGTWGCTFTVSDAESDGGSNAGSDTVAITAGAGGELTEIVSGSDTDGGSWSCTVSASTTSGTTATENPSQTCNGSTVETGTGLQTVSGNTLTYTETLAPWEGGTVAQSVSGTCTRQ